MDTKSKDTVHYKYYREITLDRQFKEARAKMEMLREFVEQDGDTMHGESGYTKRELQSIRRFLKGL